MNCKSGDLAYISGMFGKWAVNNGHIVKVLARAEAHPKFGPAWRCEASCGLLARHRGTGETRIHPNGGVGRISDCFLRPIGNPGDGIPVEDVLTLKEPA